MSQFVITGAKGGTTQGAPAANRREAREINDLIQDQQQFSLYIQALTKPLSLYPQYRTSAYWDRATNIIPPLKVISLESVNIVAPDGNTTAVPNTLLQYTFNPIDPSFPAPYSSWQTTVRHPDDSTVQTRPLTLRP